MNKRLQNDADNSNMNQMDVRPSRQDLYRAIDSTMSPEMQNHVILVHDGRIRLRDMYSTCRW